MRPVRLLCLVTVLLSLAGSASAQSYTSVVVFGDSLSDTGNDLHLFHDKYFGAADFPVPMYGYTRGRFTDGTDTSPAAAMWTGVWVEQLAASFAAHPTVTNSLDGGTDYAYGYAQTGTGTSNLQIAPAVDVDVNNLTTQVDTYLAAQPHVPAGTLVVVWGGANDLLAAAAAPTPQQAQSIIAAAVSNETAIVQRLIAAGATDILVANLPPLGLVPRFNTNPTDSATATAGAQAFNNGLQTALTSVASGSPAHLFQLDTFTLFNAIVAAPATYNLINVTAMSQGTSANPDQYLFWDDLHPTTAGHHLLAAAALALLTPAPVSTTTTVTSSAASSNLNSSVTFTATVTATAGVPAGTVTFADGTTTLGTGTLNAAGATSSTATFSTSGLTAGTHAITASYGGATGFAGSTSAAFTQTVTAPAITVTASPTTITVNAGATGNSTLTVTPVGGFNGSVSFACQSVPTNAFCNVNDTPPQTFSAPQTFTLTIVTDGKAPPTPAGLLALSLAGPGPLLVGSVVAFSLVLLRHARRRAPQLRPGLLVLVFLLSSASLLGLSGCGGSSHNTPKGTYTVAVVATPSTGSPVTTNVTLVVQ